MGNIKSAGFMGINRIKQRVVCNGRSDSLNVDSLLEDSDFFTNYFNQSLECNVYGNSTVVFASNMPIESFEQFNVELGDSDVNLSLLTYL